MTYEEKRRLDVRFMTALVKPFIRLKFRFSYDSFKDVKGPYLLLCNHVTDFDPVFMLISAGRFVRFVASEHIMRKGIATKFLTRYARLIVHTKGAGTGMRSAMEILKALRNGDSVGLFPEGNRCFNGETCFIPPVTGKLAKMAGVNVVTCRLEGGYLSQPRWGSKTRRGKVYAHLVHVYTPEEMQALSAEEAQAAIEKDLYENAYESEKTNPVAFRSCAPTEGLESALFACPSCKRFGTLSGLKNRLSCACGFMAEMDRFGFLHTGKGEELTVTALDKAQRELLRKRAEEAPEETLFTDEVHVKSIGSNHEVLSEKDMILAGNATGAVADGKHILFEKVQGAAIRSRNTLNVFLEGGAQYEITGKRYFNGLKYLYLYRLYKKEILF